MKYKTGAKMPSKFVIAALLGFAFSPSLWADCDAAVARCEATAKNAHAVCDLNSDHGAVPAEAQPFLREYNSLIRDAQSKVGGQGCAKSEGFAKLREAHGKHAQACMERAESCLSTCEDLAVNCPVSRRGRFRVLLGQCLVSKDEGRIARNTKGAYDDALHALADCRQPAASN